MEVQCHAFLTSALEGQLHTSAASPQKRQPPTPATIGEKATWNQGARLGALEKR